MKVTVLSYSNSLEGIKEACKISRGNEFTEEMFKRILNSGHMSIIEHASITFKIEGISRVCSHQFVRHRIGCTYTQESQRHREIGAYIIPDYFNELTKEALYTTIDEFQNRSSEINVPKEEVRYLAPNASATSIVATFTLRALWHFLDLRVCSRAQREIRELAMLMYVEASKSISLIMGFWNPRCIKSFGRYCSEPCSERKDILKWFRLEEANVFNYPTITKDV